MLIIELAYNFIMNMFFINHLYMYLYIYIYKIFAGRTCSLQVIGETLEAVEATRRGEENIGSTVIN